MGEHPRNPVAGGGLATYSAFGRQRGGLLYVLQALDGLIMQALFLALPMEGWWRPALLLLPYGGYFLARGWVWRRLYGSIGHLESVRSLGAARTTVYSSLAVWFVIAAGWTAQAGVAALGSLVWLIPLGLLPVALGRFPVDWPITAWAASLILADLTRGPATFTQTVGMLAVGVALAAYGWYEHVLFRKGMKQCGA